MMMIQDNRDRITCLECDKYIYKQVALKPTREPDSNMYSFEVFPFTALFLQFIPAFDLIGFEHVQGRL